MGLLPPGITNVNSLGVARGKIAVDTSDIRNAVTVTKQGVRQMQDAWRQGGRAVQAFVSDIRTMRSELVALSAAGAAFTGFGVRAAANLQDVRTELTGIAGGTQQANRLMRTLRDQASELKVPFDGVLQVARQILPTLEGNTDELERYLDLTRRLAVRNQREGLAGAAFSINEALSSGGTDLVSLAERFNISRHQLRQAIEENAGDFGAALDQVLTRMGITSEVADQMGQNFNSSFRLAMDAAQQFLAVGAQPFLDKFLTPALQQGAQWLNQMREASPVLGTVATALGGVTAVGGGSLLVLGQIVDTMTKLRGLNIAGTLGRAGGFGLATAGGLAAGTALGIGAARGIGVVSGRKDMQDFDLQRLGQILRQVFTIFINVVGKAQVTLTQLIGIFELLGLRSKDALGRLIESIGAFVIRLGQMLGNEGLGQSGKSIQQFGRDMQLTSEQWASAAERIAQRVEAAEQAAQARTLRVAGVSARPFDTELAHLAPNRGAASGGGSAFSSDQINAFRAYEADIAQVERDAQEQRLTATQQYEERRTSIIADAEQRIARMDEDRAIQRAREDEDLEKTIAEIRRDGQGREAEAAEAHGERMADIQADAQEKLLDLQRSHRNNLFRAAQRLDAAAIATENLNYQDRRRELEDDLEKRLAQEQESYAERLQTAREADEQRIRDLRDNLRERRRIEDEDYALQLQRMRQDTLQQLNELDAAHQARMQQIDQQEQQKLLLLRDRFIEQMVALGAMWQARNQIEANAMEAAAERLADWWQDIQEMFSGGATPTQTDQENRPWAYMQSGGPVGQTGPAILHAGEFVLNPETTSLLRGMLGGGFTQPQLVGAMGGMSVNMPIFAAPGSDPVSIGDEVENRLRKLFAEWGGG